MFLQNRAPAIQLKLPVTDSCVGNVDNLLCTQMPMLHVAKTINGWQFGTPVENSIKIPYPFIVAPGVANLVTGLTVSAVGPAFAPGEQRRFVTTPGDVLFAPFTRGGHHPCTWWAMYRLASTPAGDAIAIGNIAGSGPLGMCIKTNGSGQPQGYLRTNADGSGLTLSGTAPGNGVTVSIAFTSRGLTDHALAIFVVNTQVRELVTSSTSRNNATANPGNSNRIGMGTGIGDIWFLSTADILGGAFIDRALSNDELMQLVVGYSQLLREPYNSRFGEASAAVIRRLVARTRILGG
jgi:hypothetical protein